MKALDGRVAVVTGASRGVGRGIALSLGELGATVVVTGRTGRGERGVGGVGGTVDDTADEVSRRGGRGVAHRCDHTIAAQVADLFAGVRADFGKLDLLVSNAWGGYERYSEDGAFDAPFTEQPLDVRWDAMFERGVRCHLRTLQAGLPLLLERGSGLVVLTTAWDRDRYLGSLVYDLAKYAVVRMALGLGRELGPRGITALALAPGFTRTERVLAEHAKHPFDLGPTESPEHSGRAVAALASDPQVSRWNGKVVRAGDLSAHYGFTDVDGRRIPAFEMPGD